MERLWKRKWHRRWDKEGARSSPPVIECKATDWATYPLATHTHTHTHTQPHPSHPLICTVPPWGPEAGAAATDGAREPAVLTHTHTRTPPLIHFGQWRRIGVVCGSWFWSVPWSSGGGPSQSVKWFLCSLCVSATVGSACVNETPLCFIVHEVRGFMVTWDKHTDTLIET